MVWQRAIAVLRSIRGALRAAFSALAARAAAFWRQLRSEAWLAAACGRPFVWLARKIWWLVRVLAGAILSLLRLGPLELLKRSATVIISLTGLLALLWVGVQIVFPPIVITVAKFPEPLEKEYWLNTELSRALSDQLERIRAAVRDERSPSFEAVLNPPNIVVKTGDFSLNIQEQILGPLGMLLRRSPGEAHIAVTCFHPGCMRTSDAECRDIIPAPKPNADAKAPVKQYLCLRAIVDIRRGAVQRRLTPQLALSNDTYDVEMTKQIGRIAEAVTAVADPATAALYFYRRIQQEGEATRSVTNDPEVLAELRGEAFKAAAQAESQDTVSACWAHSIRARLAIDRREFILAETYIARAKEIPRWRSTLTPDCQRLIAVTEMELARRLVLRAAKRFPEHPDDRDLQRRLAAYDRVDKTLAGLTQVSASWAPALVGQYTDQRDLIDALTLARAEIGISWFNVREQCRLLKGERPPPAQLIVDPAAAKIEDDDESEEDDALRAQLELNKEKVWLVIQEAAKSIKALKLQERLTPLRRQAAMGFLQRISRNKDCLERTLDLAQRLYLNHPNDPEMTRMFAGLVESWALTADMDDRNTILERARSIYERMVDIGDDKIDMFALSRLAFINAAFAADTGVQQHDYVGPNPEILRHVTRAWQRYQRSLYPTDIRHHAEFMLSFWGSLLLLAYPDEVLDKEFPPETAVAQPADSLQVRSAIARKAEFQQALQVLFPRAQPVKLADLSRLAGIGTRIMCFCLLTRMTIEGEGADFYMTKANKWQLSSPTLATCHRDLLPRVSAAAALRAKKAFDEANEEFNTVKAALEQKEGAAADLQVTIEIMKAGLAEKEDAMKAAEEALAKDRKDLEIKTATLAKADKTCRVPKLS